MGTEDDGDGGDFEDGGGDGAVALGLEEVGGVQAGDALGSRHEQLVVDREGGQGAEGLGLGPPP